MAAGLYGRPAGSAAGDREQQHGPGLDELTLEYAPPEVLFSTRYHHPLSAGPALLHAYDVWSAGVVMLELVLGSPAVFAPSPPTRAALDKELRLRGKAVEERQLLYLLRGLMELCLYPPRAASDSDGKKGDDDDKGDFMPASCVGVKAAEWIPGTVAKCKLPAGHKQLQASVWQGAVYK
eukprot:gene5289-5525_t